MSRYSIQRKISGTGAAPDVVEWEPKIMRGSASSHSLPSPEASEFREAWVNTEVSSPNSVPYVSTRSNAVYTCGTREGKWTIEALNWSTGESLGCWVTGDSRFNTLGSGVQLDNEGQILFGSIFGKTRILRPPSQFTEVKQD